MIRKTMKGIISLLLVFSSLQLVGYETVENVSAAQEYPLYCGSSYEVSIANADGTFSKDSCVGSFSEAKAIMATKGENAVVRHSSSLSPMKVVAMNSGIAISYPMRSGSTTMNVYQNISHVYKKATYVTKHRELKYFETLSYDGNGNGNVLINITGFEGTANLKEMDLIPFIFSKSERAVLLGGNDATAAQEAPFWNHVYQAHYVIQQNGNYKDLTYKAYSGWADSTTYPATFTMTVGPAASWMNVGATYYSYDGYTFYSDYKYTNKVGVYYNYYQFVPLRSQSAVSAQTLDNYLLSIKGTGTNSKMKNQGQAFVNGQNKYGVNALLVYALASLESAYGTSNYALERNNLFGWNAFDSAPGQASYFTSIEAAVNEHMGINLRGYMNIEDARFFGSHVGNKGSGFNVKYASDPYWGYKIAAIAYDIDKFANNRNGNLLDDKVTVGVINSYGVDIKAAETGNTVLYNSRYGSTYQENHTVVLLEERAGNYKIRSTNPVVGEKIITGTTTGLVNYDWNASVGYIAKDKVTPFGSVEIVVNVGEEPTGEFVSNVKTFATQNEKLVIQGEAYRPGIYVTDTNQVKQTITLVDAQGKEVTYDATSTVVENQKVSYEVKIDLASLPIGNYYFKVKTEYSRLIQYSREFIGSMSQLDFAKITLNDKEITAKIDENLIFIEVKEYKEPEVVIPEAFEKSLRQDILTFNYDKTREEVSLSGYAFISGMDAKADTNLTQRVYLYNMETKEKVNFTVETTSLVQPISFNDGFEYKKIQYSAKLNISSLPIGNYALFVEVENGTVIKTAEIKNYYNQIKPENFVKNNYNYRFVINQLYGYRYELQIENVQLDYTTIKKPTTRNSTFDFASMAINNDTLTLNGIAWIYGADANSTTNPTYRLVLANETGALTYEPLTTKTCDVDYSKMLGLKFATTNACFAGNVNLSGKALGNYRMYLEISTKEYKDVFELYDFYDRSISSGATATKKYGIKNSSTRKRLILTITGA